MILHPRAHPYTAFTVPGMGQFQWVTSPMGLLGCPASFQRLMETVVHGLTNVIVYIDNLLVHSATHPEQITALDNIFAMTGPTSHQDKLAKMLLWQQGSFIPWVLADRTRYFARHRQTQGCQKYATARQCTRGSTISGPLQLLQMLCSQLRPVNCTTHGSYKTGLLLERRHPAS
jgi:hypothetical protein